MTANGPGRSSPVARRRRENDRPAWAWRAGFRAGERSAADLLASVPTSAGELLEELLRIYDEDDST